MKKKKEEMTDDEFEKMLEKMDSEKFSKMLDKVIKDDEAKASKGVKYNA